MENELTGLIGEYRSGRLSRRDFVQRGLAMGFTISTLGLILHNVSPARAAGLHAPAQAPKKGGTLRVTIEGPGTSLDPALISDTATIGITHNIYNFLVRTDPNGVPYPDLATSWKTSADGLTWTFPLHTGVTFHSGKAFTAADVVYTIQRIQNPKTGSAAASLFTNVTSVTAADDHTVVFHLKAPYPDLPVALADYHMCIVENNFSGNYTTNPSGTGPWMLKEFVPADHALIVRNPKYFQAGLPYLDAIRFVFLPNASTQVAALQSGSVDFIMELDVNQAKPLTNASGITMPIKPNSGFQLIHMRSDRPPFNDPRVRMAFKLVTDRAAINQVLFAGKGVLADDQPIAPAYTQWYTNIGTKARDVTKAKALLSAAGYGKGINANLYTSTLVGGPDFAIAYQQMAADANIDLKLVVESTSDYYAKDWLSSDLAITSWGARDAPALILNLLFRSGAVWNEGHYSNKKLDALIDASGSTMDPAKRKALYKQIEILISNDGPAIIPVFSAFAFPYRSRVQGFTPIPNTFHYYLTAWLSS
jgi:peptide/nickel transport system substrate-binding protein